MCLAQIAKIKKKRGNEVWADLGGLVKKIKIILTPNVKTGDYVILHAGFAIQKIGKREFEEMKKLCLSLGIVQQHRQSSKKLKK